MHLLAPSTFLLPLLVLGGLVLEKKKTIVPIADSAYIFVYNSVLNKCESKATRKHIFEDYHEISLTPLTTTHHHLNLPSLQWANQEGQDHWLDPAMFAETRMSCGVSSVHVCRSVWDRGTVRECWEHHHSTVVTQADIKLLL